MKYVRLAAEWEAKGAQWQHVEDGTPADIECMKRRQEECGLTPGGMASDSGS